MWFDQRSLMRKATAFHRSLGWRLGLTIILSVGRGLAQTQDLSGGEAGWEDAEALEKELLAELEKASLPSAWTTSADLRTWTGYKDNVLLSTFDPVSAPLIGAGGDFILSRLPTAGTEFMLLATGDYIQFLGSPEAEPEALALVQAEARRKLGSGWTLATTAQYIYSHQVFDVSATEAELATTKARGNTFQVAPALEWVPERNWRTELVVNGGRQWFSAPLDDYWELSPVARVVREFKPTFDLALSYRFVERWFDTRPPLDARGDSLPGILRFTQNEVELRPQFYFGTKRQWQLGLRLGALLNQDNGEGYFDYVRYATGLQLRGTAGKWSFRAGSLVYTYNYPVQQVSGPLSPLRHKNDFTVLARVEFRLSRKLFLFTQYDGESALDNLPDADYDVNMYSLGIEREW